MNKMDGYGPHMQSDQSFEQWMRTQGMTPKNVRCGFVPAKREIQSVKDGDWSNPEVMKEVEVLDGQGIINAFRRRMVALKNEGKITFPVYYKILDVIYEIEKEYHASLPKPDDLDKSISEAENALRDIKRYNKEISEKTPMKDTDCKFESSAGYCDHKEMKELGATCYNIRRVGACPKGRRV